MKKLISVLLCLAMSFSLVACGGSSNPQDEKETLTTLASVDDIEDNQILSGAAVAINVLKTNLKNPHSLEIFSLECKTDAMAGAYFYEINYSAENDLGGKVEDYFYISVETAKFDYSLAQFEKDGESETEKIYKNRGTNVISVDIEKAMRLCDKVF